jgi:hypothetical protein
LKKKVLYAFAIWCGLLVFGAMCVGAGVWKLRSAADTIRNNNLTEVDAQDFAGDIAWSNRLLKFAKFNPGVQMLRVVPGVSWAPQAVSAGSNVVAGVHSLLENGGAEILNVALSGELTPEPGTIDAKAAVGVAENALQMGDRVLRLRSAVADIGGLHVPGVDDSRIDDAVAKATDYLDLAESAVVAMKQLPKLVGSDAPVRYFVGITNEAELRGIQGIIGEYAIVVIDNGKISVSRTGSNTELVNPKSLPPELVGEYSAVFGETNTEWQNVNLSPFLDPAAAQITYAWKLQTGESLDGVVLLDTVALAKWAIPKVGSVQSAQGRVLETWEALADYLSNGVYFEFPTNQDARKQFQSELAGQLIEAITGSSLEPQQLIRSLAKPMTDGRVVAWLNGEVGSEFNETVLARSSNSFPDDVVIGYNNLTGNKMDFYLNVDAGGSTCRAVELRFTSTADPNVRYPDYLARRLDADEEALIGSYLAVNAVFPQGVEVVAVEEAGEPVSFDRYAIDGTRTFVRTWVEVPVGRMRDITYIVDSSRDYCYAGIRVPPLRHTVG